MRRTPSVIWKPWPGAQQKFLTCPVWECLLAGNRGGGKTDVLIMDFLQNVGKGYGEDYKGLILREATTELGDVISKTRKWIPRIFPLAKYNGSKKIWTFPEGETLWLNYARVDADYEQYHGHAYQFIGWEEITNHALPNIYLKLMSCSRTANPKVPLKYRATCNPSGPGHSWIKKRFIDAVKPGKIFREELEFEFPDEKGNTVKQKKVISRTHVKSYQSENKSLVEADPLYIAKLYGLTKDNEMLRKAWIDGSWDLLIGGFFTDVWDEKIHVLPDFDIPRSWNLVRGFDWGSSKPWAVSYAFESNGEQPQTEGLPYMPKGSVVIPTEIYGWNGIPNEGDRATSQEIAERVLDVDNSLLIQYGIKAIPGPADTSIWDVRDGTSIANNLSTHGCRWTRAYKGSGSRVSGWALIRQMLGAAKRGSLESPHLYFLEQAAHHIRTIPIQQRDKKKPEDIQTDGEDHCLHFNAEVITDQGIRRIGDLVDTSGNILSVNGKFVPYENCRLIQKNVDVIQVTFSDGHSVICTPDHKFLTTIGFIEAKDLILSDICVIVSKTQTEEELCYKKEFKKSDHYQKQNKGLIQKRIINVVNIFRTMVKDYIEKFGFIIKEKFLKDFMFIIKMKTNPTINFTTLNYCTDQNTYQFIKQGIQEHQQKRHWIKQQNGIKVQKVWNGIISIMKTQKKPCIPKFKGLVSIVENLVKLQEEMPMSSVLENVKHNGEKNQELMMLKESVQYVPVHLQSINTQLDKHVQVNAHQNYVLGITGISILKEKSDVYCLEVPEHHTFALKNGVLVSNCMDSLRYLLSRKLTTMKRKKVGT